MGSKRGNVFENNCYYGVMRPLVDTGSMNVNPGFAGTDYTDKNSFKLSADSPLINAGATIDDDVTTDFFGEEIKSSNIGCYAGEGVDVEYIGESFIQKFIRTIIDLFETVIHEIIVIFD